MEFRDYYATLGVTKTATDKELKQAFRRLARKFHPDVNQTDSTAETRFKEVNEAYEVLGDPDKRRKYDELGANWKAYEQAGVDPRSGAPFGQAGSPFGQGAYRQVSPDEMGEMFGDVNPFSDFFKTFFGAAGDGSTVRGGTRGRPRVQQEHELVIGLEEAFTGTARKVTVTSPEGERSLEVRFPAGITDGQKVRAPSDGGDVFFRVRIAPHPRVERRGPSDLSVRVPVPVAVAVVGGEVEVLPLTGRAIRMRVPPGTAHGAVLRLRGHGMPVLGSAGTRGDLLVSLELQVPTDLSAEERAHYEALAVLRGAARTQPA